MPTTTQRISAILASAVILTGGAFAASLVPSVKANEKSTVEVGLEVTIEGVRNGNGHVIILIMDDADAYNAFDYDAAAGYREIAAAAGGVTATFAGLPTGRYAVVAFHDENGNRDLDMNDTIPGEGYAVSGARDAFDAPAFDRASSDERSRRVQMYYLN
ncbi:MAG: DUF2141 domain-containing protein [Pseudomonadota bacterium]